ncbi:MAG: sigma-70 family RNA polymerase sigma factor [candidate division WOR-3 bacterium]|nr:MAG: sigma-70 family RNA polymerase sigma factor [candidate division WOR-3 bacterium]
MNTAQQARLDTAPVYNKDAVKKKQHILDPDVELIERTARGDEQAFEQIMAKYERAVFNTIYRYIGNYDDVEDIAQEVFLRVWRHAGKFKGRSKFSTWLYRITANRCLTYRSKHKQPPISLDNMVEKGMIPDSLKTQTDILQRERVRVIQQALDELPERQRMALVLCQYDGLSYKEIASAMKVSVSSVESLIFRARTALRKRFDILRKQGRL